MLLRSPFAFVEGTVDIGGKPTLVRYQFDQDKDASYPDSGWQGMDSKGDGHFDEAMNMNEYTLARDESVIFHVNGHDVSTLTVDLKTQTVVLREHPAGENNRISLLVGDTILDFQFTDLDGKPHRFSEFHGKYVLLDFWGTWCGPCRAESPDLEKIYQQFRPRGLTILGMGDDKETEKVRKVLSEAGVTFPQSSGETGNALVHKRVPYRRLSRQRLWSVPRARCSVLVSTYPNPWPQPSTSYCLRQSKGQARKHIRGRRVVRPPQSALNPARRPACR